MVGEILEEADLEGYQQMLSKYRRTAVYESVTQKLEVVRDIDISLSVTDNVVSEV